MKKKALLTFLMFTALFVQSYAQENTVSGKVVAYEDGGPLPGVSILIKDTNKGVLTDENGEYSLGIPDSISNPVLLFSFVGFETKEVKIGTQTLINVTLKTDTKELKEVVVVGYGVIDREKLAGSVSSIGAEDIETDPVAGINQAVQGKMAGVQVTQNSGTPGGGLNFRIRGINTLNSSTTEPLYVIDGVPINTDNYVGISRSGRQSLNPLAAINPSDISSIEVLKDASATAIYGARAANGVVLVTTKRGTSGKSQITFNGYYGVQELPNKIEMANSEQYINFVNDIYALNETEPNEALLQNNANTNWQDEVYRTAPMQSYSLSVSGGSDNTTYYLSGSYFNQEGIVINSGFERVNFRSNIEHSINDRVKIGANLNLSRSTNDRIPEDFGRSAPVLLSLITRPNIPVYEETGDYYLDPIIQRDNAVAVAELTQYQDQTDRLIGNVFAEFELVKGLTFRTNWGIDKTLIDGEFYIPREGIIEGANKQGFRTTKRYRSDNWLNENTLTYTNTFGDHAITVLAGNTLQKADIEEITLNATNFTSDEVTNIGAAGVYTTSDRLSAWSLASFFSRVNYIFKDRYILTANYRIDGSSRFGKDNKYARFPSVAVAWRMSEEDFIRDNIPVISNLKLRASWGQSGNQPRDFYEALPLYGVNAYYGSDVGFAPSVIGNSELSWETTTQTDIGLDIGLFADRISILADYYIKNTEDLLVSYRMPEATGELFTLINLGEVQNKGFEFELSTKNIIGEKFRWNTNLNMSFVENKVTSLPGGDVLDGMDDASHLAREGYPLGSFFGYVAEGVDSETGSIIYADIDGDGERTVAGALDTDDRKVIGNPHPDFYGGITNTFFYGPLDLSIQGQFVYGNDVFNFTRRTYEALTSPNNNISVDALDYWRQPGDITDTPKPTIGQSTNGLVSTRWIEDGSFFRIRDVTLGFTLPENMSSKVKVNMLRMYLQVQNLYNFTSYSGYDPEINVYENRGSMIGADYASYPRARTYLFGLNITL
ncbi:SusC/RagA family TonB-linked outer membrane protein [Chondrinema litorale]|uniref:SusC/RagA family TonB-linked outer membrane protein n=1 Tax=Chondrinema litorale TaxID=2994555 RepID=UPI002543005C|nr:TonB-dependent receptor [Chondrinema litorale]UZR98818.1 TonB-dependent receptor [Chondrinema litorale]